MSEPPPPELLRVGGVEVRVTRSCARRDLYDLTCGRPLPISLRAQLAERGALSGDEALWVIDVPGVHRVTVAPAKGRVVLLPRLAPTREAQRRDALALARWLDEALAQAG